MFFTLDFKGDYVVKSVVNFFILGLLFFCTLNIYADDTDSRALEFLNRAIVSLGRGEYQDAVAYSRNCSLLSPELGDGWYGEALALIAGKQPVYEILAALEKAGSCNRWIFYNKKQRYQDSNLEMLESESSALPFGDSASLYSDSLYKSEKRGQEDSNPRPSGP